MTIHYATQPTYSCAAKRLVEKKRFYALFCQAKARSGKTEHSFDQPCILQHIIVSFSSGNAKAGLGSTMANNYRWSAELQDTEKQRCCSKHRRLAKCAAVSGVVSTVLTVAFVLVWCLYDGDKAFVAIKAWELLELVD